MASLTDTAAEADLSALVARSGAQLREKLAPGGRLIRPRASLPSQS